MFKKIKEFFTGKPAEVVESVPYKVEVSAPVVEIIPAGTETSVAAPAAKSKKAPAKKSPAVKKPRAPKAAK